MEPDIKLLSVLYNKMNSELTLVKEQLKNAKEELMSTKLQKNEIQWALQEKTKLITNNYAQENIMKKLIEKLEKENAETLYQNKTLALQLEISAKSYEEMKQSMKSLESEKYDYLHQIQVLKSQIQEYQKFKSALIGNNENINQSIETIKERLNDFKEEQTKSCKLNNSILNHEELVRANTSLQEMLRQGIAEKNAIQEQLCYYKEMSEHLQMFIDSEDGDKFFYMQKWQENNIKYKKLFDFLSESNKELKEVILSKYQELITEDE